MSSTPNVPAVLLQDARVPHALLSHHLELGSSKEEKVSKEKNSSLKRKVRGNSFANEEISKRIDQ